MSLNFPLLLVIAVFVCGLLGLIDLLFLAPRRRAARPDIPMTVWLGLLGALLTASVFLNLVLFLSRH